MFPRSCFVRVPRHVRRRLSAYDHGLLDAGGLAEHVAVRVRVGQYPDVSEAMVEVLVELSGTLAETSV